MTRRGGVQIEITPEMIEAGREVLLDFEWEWEPASECVRKILEASLAVFSRSVLLSGRRVR